MKLNSHFIKYKERISKNIFLQNILIVAGGNITAKITAIILTPIITRLYTPSDYGIFNIFISILGIIGSLATLRYAVTIPLAKNDYSADNLVKLCFLVTLSLSFFWMIVILIFGDSISEYYKSQQLKKFLLLLPIVFLGKGIYETLNNWGIRRKYFKLITKTKISQSISSSLIKIGFGVAGVTPLGLFLGYLGEEVVGISSLFKKFFKERMGFFHSFSLNQIKKIAVRYKKFPLFQSWSQLLLSIGTQLPVLLLGSFYGIEIVGVFGLAQSMINIPMDLIGQSVSQVYYGEISKYGKKEVELMHKLSVSLMKRLFLIGLIPVGFLIAFGPWTFKIIFGPEWIEAGIFARFLSIMILTRFISNPLANVFNVFEKQRLQLKLNIVRVLLVLLIFFSGYLLKVNELTIVIFYSVSMALYYLFLSVIILNVIKKENNNENF